MAGQDSDNPMGAMGGKPGMGARMGLPVVGSPMMQMTQMMMGQQMGMPQVDPSATPSA